MIPALEKWLLIAVVMLNAYSLGADCVERFVNYGSWHGLSESDFASYHQSQQPAILAFVVAPLGISFLLQLALLWKHPSPIRTGAVWVMILSSLVGAVSTAAASDPHPSSARSRLFPGANLTPDEDRLDPKSSRRHQDHRFRVSSARMPTIEETSLIRPSQLRSVPLFDCFDDGYLEDICMMTADVVLPSGEYLFFEGDPAAFYILLEGTVELSQFVVRNRHVLGTYQSGEFFGEVPLLLGSKALCDAIALTRVRITRMDQDLFRQLLSHSDTCTASLMKSLLDRVGRAGQRMEQLPVP